MRKEELDLKRFNDTQIYVSRLIVSCKTCGKNGKVEISEKVLESTEEFYERRRRRSFE